MALNTSAMATQIRSCIESIPVTVIIGTTSYTGCKSFLKKETVNSNAGLSAKYEFSVLLPAAVLSAVPAPKSQVTIGGIIYKVLAVDGDSIGATVKLHLGGLYA